MKKTLLIITVLISSFLFSGEKITGVWKSVSDTTGLVKSISVIYEYQGKVYGRVLVTYDDQGNLVDTVANPIERAPNIQGEPYYAGLDFIWDMEDRGKKWSKGKIMDPEPAKVYSCDMWREGENLIVRGKVGPFGRNQTWLPLNKLSELPEGVEIPTDFTPKIPKAK